MDNLEMKKHFDTKKFYSFYEYDKNGNVIMRDENGNVIISD